MLFHVASTTIKVYEIEVQVFAYLKFSKNIKKSNFWRRHENSFWSPLHQTVTVSWVYFKIVILPIYFNNLHRLIFCIIPRNITSSHYPQEQVDTLLKLINEINCSLNK